MATHPRAGIRTIPEDLIDPSALERAYYDIKPDPAQRSQLVSFGTSGHRGKSSDGSFNEAHILAITQAICEYRRTAGIDGPLFVGKDTHALSIPAEQTTVEVLAANSVQTIIQKDNGFTPTPAISRAILEYNRSRKTGLADGVVITPSHNPPSDGGFKYNPPNGGPADTDVTDAIQTRANELLRGENSQVNRMAFEIARRSSSIHAGDFLIPYVKDLANVLDLDVVSESGIRIGVDPLGGSAVEYWAPIAEMYKLQIEVVNPRVDPRFAFMTLDHDGKIRMDCSSPYAMAGLVGLKDKFGIAFGNDPDADRHGIVAPSIGLLNPNHYLAVAIWYLLRNRSSWPQSAAVGKTLVSSSLIDRVVSEENRRLFETPVGFKWFAPGLFNGSVCFGGEESAGASFLRKDGTVWTTDKDGLILGLLAAEITARTGRDPGEHFIEMTQKFGTPYYRRIDAPASPEQKTAFRKLTPESVTADHLAGEPIIARLTAAPGNGASIGGLKIVTANGWFAARPSGTEDLYKLYAESFCDEQHLVRILDEARSMVAAALSA